MEEKSYITKNAEQTQKIGQDFAKRLSPGDSVLLEGTLGSGKTTFVQGAAKTFGIKSRIISPTFVLVRSHKGILGSLGINLYHIDLYRIHDLNTVVDLGLLEVFEDPSGIVFIEWGQKSDQAKFKWSVSFKVTGKNQRKISINKNE